MSLSREQIISVLLCLGLLIILLTMRTKPKDLIQREQTRALNTTATNVTILRKEATSQLSSESKTQIQILEAELDQAKPEEKEEVLKQLSSAWYRAEHPSIAGHYAEQVALISNDAASWSIAGTTYALCVRRSTKDKEKTYCLDNALSCLENAISLEPDVLDHQINKAVILAENPPPENPMTGVMMLLDLNRNHPDNVSVINKIATFAIQTNQLEKAEQRLLKALSIEPNNKASNCLMVQLYQAKGSPVEAATYKAKCVR